jgi:hypothetical protein
VTAFGGDESVNHDDDWVLECTVDDHWLRAAPVRLRHAATGAYLHSTGQVRLYMYGRAFAGVTTFFYAGMASGTQHEYGRPIQGQREVCAYRVQHTDHNLWVAREVRSLDLAADSCAFYSQNRVLLG